MTTPVPADRPAIHEDRSGCLKRASEGSNQGSPKFFRSLTPVLRDRDGLSSKAVHSACGSTSGFEYVNVWRRRESRRIRDRDPGHALQGPPLQLPAILATATHGKDRPDSERARLFRIVPAAPGYHRTAIDIVNLEAGFYRRSDRVGFDLKVAVETKNPRPPRTEGPG